MIILKLIPIKLWGIDKIDFTHYEVFLWICVPLYPPIFLHLSIFHTPQLLFQKSNLGRNCRIYDILLRELYIRLDRKHGLILIDTYLEVMLAALLLYEIYIFKKINIIACTCSARSWHVDNWKSSPKRRNNLKIIII